MDGLCCCFIYSGDLGIGVVASSLNSAQICIHTFTGLGQKGALNDH